jgi:hypothetical protein
MKHAVANNKQRVALLFWAGHRAKNSSLEKTSILQNATQYLRLRLIPQDRDQCQDHLNKAVNLWVA